MTDIRLPLGAVKFSVRVGIIVVDGGRLLVNRIAGEPWTFLPGGAMSTGEDALACAAREWVEETGLTPGRLSLCGVVENFWLENFAEHHGVVARRQHEIGFYVRMTAPDGLAALPMLVADDAPAVTAFEWVPLSMVGGAQVRPACVLELIDIPHGQVRHIVNREQPPTPSR